MRTDGVNVRRGYRQAFIVGAITVVILFSILFSPLISPVISKVIEPYWDGECEECHSGFQPFSVTPDSPTEVPEGQEFDYRLIIENPWLHELRNVQVVLDLSEAPNLASAAGGDDTQVTEDIDGSISAGSRVTGTIAVETGASEILLQMYYADPIIFAGDLNLALSGPEGGRWTSDLSDTTEVIRVGREEILGEGPGEYTWTIESEAAFRSVDYYLTTAVTYSGASIVVLEMDSIGSTESSTAEFRLTSSGRGENVVSFMVTAEAYHDHGGNQPDTDVYQDDGSSEISIGDTYSYSSPRSSISTATALWYSGRVLAFVTVFLFVTSFLTGGSILPVKKWLDKRMKKRTKFHCAVSFLTVKLALVHLIVLYAGLYSGTYKGIFLGGLTLLLMIGLGLTGLFKQRIVPRIGEPNWRKVHFWLSIVVLVLIAIHAVKEGTDLAFLRFW
ncbi:MAG: hypothetical protein ACMUHM_05490 [Thermoplasmatota archaeon]